MRQVFGEYPILDFLPKLQQALPSSKIVLKNINVNCKSVRLQLFANRDCECVCCGKRADKFVLEKLNPDDILPHLNMYGRRDNGTLLLFTKDHILPRSLSGSNALFNMQIMCADCNSKKSYKIQLWDIVAIAKQLIKGQASIKRLLLSRR